MAAHVARRLRIGPIAAQIHLAGQDAGDQRVKTAAIPGAKSQRRAAPQFLRAAQIRSQQRDMAAMHFQRDLRQIVFP